MSRTTILDVTARRERVRELFPELGGNATHVAAELGVSRWTIREDLRALGLYSQPISFAAQREQARSRYAAGESQRSIAQSFGVSYATVFRWVQGVERETSTGEELSVRQAAAASRINKENLLAAIKDGRLVARFGAFATTNGRPGPTHHWIIGRDDLDRFVAMLECCRYPGCTLLGVTPLGYCGRRHQGSTNFEKAWTEGHDWAKAIVRNGASPSVRRRREGQWKLDEVRGAGRVQKGKKEALEVGTEALKLVQQYRVAAITRSGRRAIIENLMAQFVCSGEVIEKGTADTGYRNAKEKIRVRLKRAQLEGINGLEPLL